MLIFLFRITLCCLAFSAWADYLPRERAVPGGVIHVPIESANLPTVYFDDARVSVLASGEKTASTGWLAVIGIPITAKPGEYFLQVASPLREQITFDIQAKQYPQVSIKLSEAVITMATLDNAKRIGKEQKIINDALASWTSTNPFTQPFIAPLQGRISGYYGAIRYVNDSWRLPHTGIDIAAPTNTPVIAPLTGIVLATGDFTFLGNTVILDHGQGLITLYSHLNTIGVKKNDYVAQGKPIGTVGQTGRTSGPHLHWSIALNQTFVDPLLFISHTELFPYVSLEQLTP